MELCDIYCGFWEGMKEISVGVCLNEYTWLEIWEKEKLIVQKDQVKKNDLEQKKKNGEKKSRSAIWALLCKVSRIGIIWKKNYAPLVFRNYIVLIYIFFLHSFFSLGLFKYSTFLFLKFPTMYIHLGTPLHLFLSFLLKNHNKYHIAPLIFNLGIEKLVFLFNV